MKKLIILGLALVSIIGCSSKKEESEKMKMLTYGEQSIEIKENIESVVVFDMAALDMLDYLQLEDKIVGLAKGSVPSYLKKYTDKKYAATGDFFEPDFEKLSELNPDLIIISNRTAEKLDQLNKIAPTLLLPTDSKNLYASFEDNAKVLGEVFGKENEVEARLIAQQDKLKEVKENINPKLNTLILMTSDSKISVYGKTSRFALIHDTLGIPMADPNIEESTHGQSVNYEYLSQKNPQLIYVLDRDYAIKANDKIDNSVLDNSLVKAVDASKNKQIYYLDGEAWYISGLAFQSFDIMINDLKPSYEK